ncbi:MAG: hypothetical protein JW955_19255 [Sedimentisphaerales bacterium]|nr:hypothetical protein [Sedimentisphaerales bacterium]
MNRRLVLVFLEGADDERFFDGVIRPILAQRYDNVVPWKYAQRSKDDVKKALKSVQDQKANCLFLVDINTHPCVSARKQGLLDTYGKRIDPSWIVVVVSEIESWYLAGLDDEHALELGLSPVHHTDRLTKEQFAGMVPRRLDSVAAFMNEILKSFRIETAKTRNRSFCYFMDKLEASPKKA